MIELSKKYLNGDFNKFGVDDINKLQELIKYHSELYYNKQNPIISDKQYDDLFKILENLESKYNIDNGETKKIGSNILNSSFEKTKHSRPMISLDNTYNEKDLFDFNQRVNKNIILNSNNPKKNNNIEYILEFKFDGLGVELIYDDGKLIQAITRGNGIVGEDITQNVFQIDNIPKTINYKNLLEIRGEVVMPISVFNKLNETSKKTGDKIFSNPRNAASGSLRLINNLITKKRKLQFFAYDLANFDDFIKKANINNYFEVIKKLEKLGFNVSSYFKKLNNINEVINEIGNFGDLKKSLDFEIDGLVLKVNNISLWEIIGRTEHHPKYAIAYKFPAEIMTTKVISVEHSIGRTGTITPIAHLEPINIGGVIVKRSTLHNYEEIKNLDLRIGDNVFIKRAGEVIPKIISVIKEARDKKVLSNSIILAPEFCPSCFSLVKKDKDKVRYYCPNKLTCPAQNLEKIVWSVGKQGFNIDGLGEKQVELFLLKGIIINLVDIFKLEEKKEKILELEGFQEKAVVNLINSIKIAKNLDISRFLTALGIPGVGKKTAKTLGKLFKAKDDLLEFNFEIENLESLDDIGPEIANNFILFFKDKTNKIMIEKLVQILNIDFNLGSIIKKNSIYFGKKMCITGSFPSNGKVDGYSREQLIKKLEKVGGEFVSSISKNTDYLLAGEKAGSKLKKALELGIKIIDLKYFLDNSKL